MKRSREKREYHRFLWAWAKYLILPFFVIWALGTYVEHNRQKEMNAWVKEAGNQTEAIHYMDSVDHIFHGRATPITKEDSDRIFADTVGLQNQQNIEDAVDNYLQGSK